DRVSATLARYPSIDQACADGYHVSSEQNPNMGIHMSHGRYHGDGVFDVEKPEMLLFAQAGGEKFSKQELGGCRKRRWTGPPGFRIVGAAYMLPTEDHGESHPEGFAGPIDNWHVHYQSCIGAAMDEILTREQCEARGGQLVEKAGWMIHAYAVPEFDNQLGVFAMFNPSIWPRAEAGAAPGSPAPGPAPGGLASAIRGFAFEPIEVEAGRAVTITNADAVPHTVTAGKPAEPSGAFDSGLLGRGESFTLRLDEPGEYEFYCTYHTFMRGRVVVK
ncbi:MAG: cupredoxin family copper-binding protein, partial [Candidatus Rokubacteria bacterium]|nr:cupredoxin family copper-binding protein [Candidatus Rokubacteria bacterium]